MTFCRLRNATVVTAAARMLVEIWELNLQRVVWPKGAKRIAQKKKIETFCGEVKGREYWTMFPWKTTSIFRTGNTIVNLWARDFILFSKWQTGASEKKISTETFEMLRLMLSFIYSTTAANATAQWCESSSAKNASSLVACHLCEFGVGDFTNHTYSKPLSPFCVFFLWVIGYWVTKNAQCRRAQWRSSLGSAFNWLHWMAAPAALGIHFTRSIIISTRQTANK